MSTKEPTASKIVKNPRLWPTSFSKPESSQNTCILTYIFSDGNNIGKFLDFVKKTLPNSKVELKKNNDGSSSVSLTSSNQLQINNDNETTLILYIL